MRNNKQARQGQRREKMDCGRFTFGKGVRRRPEFSFSDFLVAEQEISFLATCHCIVVSRTLGGPSRLKQSCAYNLCNQRSWTEFAMHLQVTGKPPRRQRAAAASQVDASASNGPRRSLEEETPCAHKRTRRTTLPETVGGSLQQRSKFPKAD